MLEGELPAKGLVLEIASGSGEHAVFFARRFPMLDWQPTDQAPSALESIAAWARDERLTNVLPPLELDAMSENWPVARADAILCINMVHISPWEATQGLFAGATRTLGESGPLILYGPYIEDHVETAPSNLAFDESLRSRNAAWGIRTVSLIDELAKKSGFVRSSRYEMPANNLTLVYRRK